MSADRRKVVWATLAGLVVVGSAFLVGLGAASGLHGAQGSASSAAAFGVTPSVASPNYTVTFSETGLNNSTNWSVTVCITQWCEDDDGAIQQISNTTSDVFSLPNGTYFFHVRAANDTPANPTSGSFSVNGASPSPILIRFGPPTLYAVTFVETGLPAGTEWGVSLDLGWGDNQNLGDQPIGRLALDGVWNGGDSNSSNGTTLTFQLVNGTYNYTVDNVSNFSIVGDANGTVNVSGGSPPPIHVAFAPVPSFPVTFVEQGLPNGTNWSISLHGSGSMGDQGDIRGAEDDSGDVGARQATDNSSMTFLLVNGTYHYRVGEVDGYYANASSGTFNVTGGNETIYVNFTALPEENVTFNESGLPNGSDWGLRIVGTTAFVHTGIHPQKIRQIHAARGLVTFHVPSGKYHYKLIPLKGWKASGGFVGKAFQVAGTPVFGQFVFQVKTPLVLAPAAAPAILSGTVHFLGGLVADVRVTALSALRLGL